MRLLLLSLAICSGLTCASASRPPADAADLPLDRITLPPGFAISLYAEGVPNARSLRLSPNGTLFVGTREEGNVYAVVDRDGDFRADVVHTLATGLHMPNGVAFRDGDLYVAEVERILRYDDIEAHLDDPPEPVVVFDAFPSDEWHGWKYINFGPDGKLYVPVGAPCNVCEREAPFASIQRLNPDGTGLETYASGVRNSVGFDWHPETGALWFTDNGRDTMGESMVQAGLLSAPEATAVTDSLPSDELNHAPRAGMHFGFPYVHAGDVPDPEFGKGRAPETYTPPARKLGPHVAALGMEFYRGAMFPEAYRGDLFIAQHGSWNRSAKSGYRVMRVELDESGRVTRYEPFATGWLADEENWGRPVDVETMPDGSLLVSDDQAGVVYRITYAAP